MARRKDVEDKLIGHIKAPRSNVLLALHDEVETEAKTKGGIIVTDATVAARNDRVGTVISVGSRIQEVKQGDRVLLDKRLGLNLTHEDQEACRLVIISEDQILAKLGGDAERDDYDVVKHGLTL